MQREDLERTQIVPTDEAVTQPGIPRPEPARAAGWPFENVRIVCSSCQTPLLLPAGAESSPRYSGHCALCDQPISVQLIFSRDDMNVVELLGCEHVGTPEALPSAETTKVERNPFATPAESFVDSLLAHWQVQTKNGKSFRFEYFSAVRKWIEEGKLGAQDVIVPADGRRYRLGTYPGTADLFGNPFVRAEARFGLQNKPAAIPRRSRRKTYSIGKTLAACAVAAAAAVAPDSIQLWRERRGAAFLRSLVAAQPAPPQGRFVVEILNGAEHFRRGTQEDLRLAERSYLRALALRPVDPEAVGGLIETWAERASDPETLGRANQLLAYAEVRSSGHPSILRAKARLLWRQNEAESALKLVERALRADPDEPETHALAAKLAIASEDYVAATLHLDRSLRLEPTNSALLADFVGLFERQSKFREAAEYLRRLANASADPSAHAERLADLHKKAGDFPAAEAVYRNALARHPNREPLRARLVALLASQNRTEEIVREAQAYLALFPRGEHADTVSEAYREALQKLGPIGRTPADPPSRGSAGRVHRWNSPRRR